MTSKESSYMNDLDLIIGETSQISRFLPLDAVRVSARNISPEIFEKSWNKVYICFAEQRTKFAKDIEYKELFRSINVILTLEVIRRIKAKKIVYFSTVELWGSLSGPISIDTPFNFEENYYTETKYTATNFIKEIESAIVLYPFNFNSRFRTKDFLFGKIFDSILSLTKIEVGNLDWDRDILHASWVANSAVKSEASQIIGSGTYFNVKKYASDLYSYFGLRIDDFVNELPSFHQNKNLIYLNSSKVLYTYDDLLTDTIKDLKYFGNKER